MSKNNKEEIFSSYQKFIIALLAVLQFTIILDFMVLSPLGAQLLEELDIATSQFGLVVSAYAFSAGISGLLAAGFADKFDRKKLLIFFYAGFIVGTIFCGIAPDFHTLLLARVVTGLFGGVITSIIYAIITDLFALQFRGRVMGFVQMAFASSQVMGIPVGLYLANIWGWHSPFLLIAGTSIFTLAAIVIYMKPIDAHVAQSKGQNVIKHLKKTISQVNYLKAFGTTTLLTTGGFMLMPFASAFSVNNLGVGLDELPLVYMVTGLFSMATGPLIGKYSDQIGKFRLFAFGSLWSMAIVIIYSHLGLTPLWIVIGINVLMFVGISSRMISSSALMTAVPEQKDRGAFMSINASVQQLSGGIASAVAGLIVVQMPGGKILHYDTLAFVVSGTMLLAIGMMYVINRYVMSKPEASQQPIPQPENLEPELVEV